LGRGPAVEKHYLRAWASKILWWRTTLFTVGWFADRTCKNKNERYTWQFKLLCNFYNMYRHFPNVIKTRKANWIGHNLRRSRFLKHFIEGKVKGRMQVTGRQERRRTQLPDDRKEKRE